MRTSCIFNCFFSFCLGVLADETVKRAGSPTVVVPSPDATFVGLPVGLVDSFEGIPFAQPPVGALRYNVPQPLDLNQSLGMINALARGPTCPQNLFDTNFADGLPQAVLGVLLDTPLFQKLGDISENCLYLNVYRPAGIDPSAKLPVLFWIHGGGFEMGFTMPQEGVPFVADSIAQGKPVIFVAVEYRVGAFGFLAGKEVLDAGVANLGLLDQRQAMKWVADNIEAFGGDPDKVTIWGESAGAISVFDHLILYDGDNTYNDKALFRAGIMNSGSVVPADSVDCPKAQWVYDHIVGETNCSGASDSLQCLRELDYETLLRATTDIPTFTGYQSIALRFLPRPDGKVITKSPEQLIQEGKFAKVPVIIGDEEDEGTLWSLMQANITTTGEVADYLNQYFFTHATQQEMDDYVATYQTITDDGSPFRTGLLNNWYPQYKRLAAILGDLAFTLSRRYFLNIRYAAAPDLHAWSYLSSYFYGLPILGTVHGSDILHIVSGVPYDYATHTMHSYYFSFIHDLDPNSNSGAPEWPKWHESNQLLNLYADYQQFIPDDFRSDSYEWITNHIPQLTM
ncbi:Alpha/Beta hydrolase protein [Xylariales sp. PMI_506]|nr:Alpha/Beta hydrolase protein [Xylariales sp. PMI_506]